VRDPAQVASAVARVLGVREQPGVSAEVALARVLARRQLLLLVLDNCEHVIGAAAALYGGLLAACDDVRVLATSREPLAIPGEARYRLGPLSLPGPDDADAGGSEAVALFADRARRADARFTLDDQARPSSAMSTMKCLATFLVLIILPTPRAMASLPRSGAPAGSLPGSCGARLRWHRAARRLRARSAARKGL
jgi:hypothetical protein